MKRRIWLAPLSAISLSVATITAMSCGNNSKDETKTSVGGAVNEAILKNAKSAKDLFNIDNYNNKNVSAPIDFNDKDAKLKLANVFSQSSYAAKPFSNDMSQQYGSYQNDVYETSAGYLLRKEYLFQPIIETKKTGISNIEYKIKRPSIWRYKLGYVSKVIVTKADGTIAEFDNDYVDTFPDYDDAQNKTFNNLAYQAIAEDDGIDNSKARKSVNGKYFFDSLINAKKIQMQIREGQKWVDWEGNETKYNVVPEDFYLSYVRTYLLNNWYRKNLLKNHGLDAEALDKEALKFLPVGTRIFTKNRKYVNYYLWDLYGFDGDSFLDESKFLQDYKGKKVLTFEANSSKNPNGGKFLFDALAIIDDFCAFPSEYVKDNQQNPQFRDYNGSSSDVAHQKEFDDFITKIKSIPNDNLVSRTATYWYGTDPNKILFAGAYYYAGYNETSQKETWKINKHFFNKDFVNGNTIKQIDIRYSNSADSESFRNQIFDDYTKGEIFRIKYSNLSENQLKLINSSPEKYGVNYTKDQNKKSVSSELQYRVIPGDVKFGPGLDVNFNEPLAKLLWGENANINNLGVLKGQNIYDDMFASYGLSFRSIISAAYNWEYSALFVSNNKKQSWIAALAQDGEINGSDAKTDKTNLVSTFSSKINSLFALDKDLNKIDFGNGNTDITPSDNLKAAESESSDDKKLRSAQYEKLSEAMTKLLDDFYAKNNNYHPENNENDKIKFSYIWRWTSYTKYRGYENLWKNNYIKNIIEGLDKKNRISVTMKYYDDSQKNNWSNSFPNTESNSIFTFDGWGYDYNGIGSGFDGRTSVIITPQMLLIGQSSVLQNRLKKAFPELVKASIAFVQFIKDKSAAGEINFSIPFDKIAEIPSKLLVNSYYNFSHFYYDAPSNEVKEDNDNTYNDDLSLINSLFWLDYSSKITNEENINLAKEFTTYGSPVVDGTRVYANNFSPTITNPHFRTPFVGIDEGWFQDIRIWE